MFVCARTTTVSYTSAVDGATSGKNDVQWTSSSNAPKKNFTNNGTWANGTYTFTAADIAAGSVTLTITSDPEGACIPASVSDQVLVTIRPDLFASISGEQLFAQVLHQP